MIVIHAIKDCGKVIGVKCDHFVISGSEVEIYGNQNLAFRGRIKPINNSKEKTLLDALVDGVNSSIMEEFEEF